MKISPIETKLKGSWIYSNGHVIEDAIANRIALLTKEFLVKIKEDDSGWNTLYVDLEDNRYWELSYPDSDFNGGGAPCLTYITKEEASSKYNIEESKL